MLRHTLADSSDRRAPYEPSGAGPDSLAVRRSNVEAWYAVLVNAYTHMDDAGKERLHTWEAANVDGDGRLATSDWPGWSDYIDVDLFWPWPDPRTERSRRKKATIPHKLRWAVWLRDDFTCRRCGTREDLSCDHVLPEAHGGPTVLDNLQTLCRPCNSRKGTTA